MLQLQKDCIYLSNLFGACSHRCQGAGGNISVKDKNILYVKASGYRLSTITEDSGIVMCDIPMIKKCLDDNIEDIDTKPKPSMEVFFHILPKKYIVHIHPTFFCKYLCRKEGRSIFSKENFVDSLYVEYTKPGIELAKKLFSLYKDESCIFLENHGIILLASTIDTLIQLYTRHETKLESIVQEKRKSSPIYLEHQIYKHTNLLAKPIYTIQNTLPTKFIAITPDHALFLKKSPLKIKDTFSLEKELDDWIQENKEQPSILQVDGHIYCLAKNYYQCQNKEEYLLSYFDIVESYKEASYMELREYDIQELNNCNKEKYRLNTL